MDPPCVIRRAERFLRKTLWTTSAKTTTSGMCSRLTATHPLQSAAPIGRTVYWPHDFTSATSLSTSSKTLSFLAPSAACIAIRTISRFRRYVLCITSADSSTRSSISRLIRKAGPPTFDTSNISDTKSESSIPSNSDPSNLRKPDPRYTDCQSETHAFGVDDANKTNSRIDHVPNPVPESGYFTQAPTGHSSLAPKSPIVGERNDRSLPPGIKPVQAAELLKPSTKFTVPYITRLTNSLVEVAQSIHCLVAIVAKPTIPYFIQ